LSNRQQRVKIGKAFLDWLKLNGGMPQSSRLGPYVFLTLINDLKACVSVHKFVDNTTLSETIVSKSDTSVMQHAADEICGWSYYNKVNVNTKKTKEMLLGSITKDPPPLITVNSSAVERVQSFKLLGVLLTSCLSWSEHITAVCTKASKWLYFLKLLKHSGIDVG